MGRKVKMNQKLLKEYARLLVKVGANVQKGQWVRLQAEVDQAPLAEAITEACYEAGAKYVELLWSCGSIDRLHYQHASVETLGTVLPWEEARAKQMTVDFPVRIFIASADPDELEGIPADILSSVSRMRAQVLKIAAAASPKWAKKVFPHESEEIAVEKLWQAILSCVYLTGKVDGETVWKQHTQRMAQKAAWLNQQEFVRLEYKSANGTDFSVDLIPGAKWAGAGDVNHCNGAFYVPNMPTEEVFTSPMKGACQGRLVSTKPLSWSGQIIDRFVVDFQDGRVVSCQAEIGEEALKKMFTIDQGASMLGELALVPKESPVNRSGLMFYNTLFDENACCHVAVGQGFGEVLEGFIEMSQEEIHDKGVNDSVIHVDFMIGSDDLNITGFRADGSAAPVFVNGTWA